MITMNRAALEILLVVTIAANLLVYNAYRSDTREANRTSIQTNASAKQHPKIVSATSRLLYHSKMIAVESLLIAKHSVNLAFDVVIKVL